MFLLGNIFCDRVYTHRHITLRAGESAQEREREEGRETKEGGGKEGASQRLSARVRSKISEFQETVHNI